jgi:AcrR family transcriptional regulator
VDAAKRLFLEGGFGSVDMDELAAAAGVARRTLYNQFASKEEIFREILERVSRQLEHAFAPGIETQGDVEEVLRLIARVIVDLHKNREYLGFLRMVVADARQLPWIAKEFAAVMDPLTERLTRYLAHLRRDPLLDTDGEPRPGGDRKTHRAGVVKDVLALADGFVSWGRDGAIRLWTLAGEPRPGGDPEAHRGGVYGVRALTDGLVSWDRDGAIRFWTLAGEPRPGGDPAAHRGEVMGVRALANGFVSWGADGVVRQWGPDRMPKGAAWVAPAPLDFVTMVDDGLWVGMLGRPHRLLLS